MNVVWVIQLRNNPVLIWNYSQVLLKIVYSLTAEKVPNYVMGPGGHWGHNVISLRFLYNYIGGDEKEGDLVGILIPVIPNGFPPIRDVVGGFALIYAHGGRDFL